MKNVLVLFQADSEHTEQLALAAAVGAVEAEGSIRLRRMAAADAVEVAHKGYGRLQEADVAWANTVVVGLESERPRAAELGGLLELLNQLDPGQLGRKQAWTFGPKGVVPGRSEAQIFVESALRIAGMVLVPMEILCPESADGLIERMKESGRMSARLSEDKA